MQVASKATSETKQRLVVGKEHFVDLEHVIAPVDDEVLDDDVGFLAVGEGIACTFQKVVRLVQRQLERHSQCEDGAFPGHVPFSRPDLGEQLPVNVGFLVDFHVRHSLLSDQAQQCAGEGFVEVVDHLLDAFFLPKRRLIPLIQGIRLHHYVAWDARRECGIMPANVGIHLLQQFLADDEGGGVEHDQVHVHVMILKISLDRLQGHTQRFFLRVTVDAAGDERESNALQSVFRCEAEGFGVGGCEELLVLPCIPAAVDGACRMNHMPRLQAESRSDGRLSRLDGSYLGAGFLHILYPRRIEDGATDASSHGQIGVRGVDDGINVHLRDVPMDDGKRHFLSPFPPMVACFRSERQHSPVPQQS